MYYLSYLRTLTNQLPAFSFRSIFEDYPKDNPLFNKINYSDIELDAFGDHYDTKSQYKFLIKELTINLEALGQYRSFNVDDEYLSQAANKTFKSSLDYQFYYNNGSYHITQMSIQSALMDFSIQLSKLSSLAEIDESILISPIAMNPLINSEMVSDTISFCVLMITNYMTSVKENMDKIMLILFIVLIIFLCYLLYDRYISPNS